MAKPGATAAAPVATYSYNARGQVLGHRDPEGTLTFNSYDPTTFDLLSTTVDADAGHLLLKTSWTYDARGDKASETNPRGLTTTYTYDVARRLNETRPAAPFTNSNVTRYGYDADGRQTTLMQYVPSTPTQAAYFATATTAYNAAGKVSSVTGPDGTKTTTTYDAVSRVATETSSSGRQVVHTYDLASHPLQLTDTVSGALDPSITVNLGAVTRETRTYLADGLLATLTDGNGNTLTYKYDGFKRPAEIIYPDSTYELHALDANGNETTTRTRSGALIKYTYDALNRVATKAPDGEHTVTYGYDFAGRALSVQQTGDAAAYTYAYDTAGRAISETSPDLGTVSWTLDANGNRTLLTWPGTPAYSVAYVYDTRDRLSDVYRTSTSGSQLQHTAYDSRSRRVSVSYGGATPVASTAYAWTEGGQASEIAHSWGGGGLTIDYAYNQDHQRTSSTYSDSSFVVAGLAAASPVYVPNALNQYGSVGGTAFSYDTRGNLTSDGVWTFGYDTENHLLSAAKTGTTVAYAYDPIGRRHAKTVNGVVTTFLSAGQQEVADYTGSPAVLQRRYAYGVGLDEPVVTVTAAGAISYPFADGLGSVVAVVSSAGVLAETHSYTAYGVSPVSTGFAFQFAGRRLDPETGLYYNRARTYSPALGRFLQADPSGTKGGLNLYAYASNDPGNLTDPTGLSPSDILESEAGYDYDSSLGAIDTAESVPLITQNAANGAAFEQLGLDYLDGINSDVAEQVSIRPYTELGDLTNYRVRLDALGTDDSSGINLYDFKSSPTAGLTRNQTAGYPLLGQYGGQVVGRNGGLAYPAGTPIPPTAVRILRPGDF